MKNTLILLGLLLAITVSLPVQAQEDKAHTFLIPVQPPEEAEVVVEVKQRFEEIPVDSLVHGYLFKDSLWKLCRLTPDDPVDDMPILFVPDENGVTATAFFAKHEEGSWFVVKRYNLLGLLVSGADIIRDSSIHCVYMRDFPLEPYLADFNRSMPMKIGPMFDRFIVGKPEFWKVGGVGHGLEYGNAESTFYVSLSREIAAQVMVQYQKAEELDDEIDMTNMKRKNFTMNVQYLRPTTGPM
jgi:hypothetical protein